MKEPDGGGTRFGRRYGPESAGADAGGFIAGSGLGRGHDDPAGERRYCVNEDEDLIGLGE